MSGFVLEMAWCLRSGFELGAALTVNGDKCVIESIEDDVEDGICRVVIKPVELGHIKPLTIQVDPVLSEIARDVVAGPEWNITPFVIGAGPTTAFATKHPLEMIDELLGSAVADGLAPGPVAALHVCECGGDKARTPHSHWCPKYA